LRCHVIYFGVEDGTAGVDAVHHAADSISCVRCGTALHYSLVLYAHVGHYRCPRCGWGRPQPALCATTVRPRGFAGTDLVVAAADGAAPHAFQLPLPGLYNAYNALAACALTVTLGLPLASALAPLGQVTAAFGRSETARVGGRVMHLLLVKNPVG